MKHNALNQRRASASDRLKIGLMVLVVSLCACSGGAQTESVAAPEQLAQAQVFTLSRPVVTLSNGYTATGSQPDTIGINHFVAIPYALPPTGARRWQAPAPWSTKAGTPSNPGDPASAAFDPAGLGAGKLPRCIPGMGAAEGDETALPSYQIPGAAELPTGVDSENCLYLNVYTKYANSAARKPVFVWIHGGANTLGTAMTALYDPTPHVGPTVPAFMETVDAVVVTINYRLGPFGFLAHPLLTAEAGTSGTYGSLDQILALQWVQSHIARFGGAADNVTVFGESAGALDINILSASPLAAGLFKRTIQESVYNFPMAWAANFSTALTEPSNVANNAVLQIDPFDSMGRPKWPTLADQERIGTGLAAVLATACPSGVVSGQPGYKPSDGSASVPWGACGYPANLSLDQLRALPSGIIGAAYAKPGAVKGTTPAGLGIFSVAPPIDGRLLTAQPLQVLKTATRVAPAVIGTNRDEYTALNLTFSRAVNTCAAQDAVGTCSGNVAGVNLLAVDGSGFKQIMQGFLGAAQGEAAFNNLPDQYKPKRGSQVDYTHARDVRDAVVSLFTDFVFTCNNRRSVRYTANAAAMEGNSYRYQFTYQPSIQQNTTPLGSARAALSGYFGPLGNVPLFPQMGATHGGEIGYVMGMTYLAEYYIPNSGYAPDGDTKVAQTFQKGWGQFGLNGTMPAVWPAGNAAWFAYPTDGLGASDPGFNIDVSVSTANGSLSSASGNLSGSAPNASACDWVDRYASYP
jgi:carboxylesterase type B